MLGQLVNRVLEPFINLFPIEGRQLPYGRGLFVPVRGHSQDPRPEWARVATRNPRIKYVVKDLKQPWPHALFDIPQYKLRLRFESSQLRLLDQIHRLIRLARQMQRHTIDPIDLDQCQIAERLTIQTVTPGPHREIIYT